jgi:prenyltransferase beta subunit
MDKLNSEVGTLYVVYTEVDENCKWVIDWDEVKSALNLIEESESDDEFLVITISHLGNDVFNVVKNTIRNLIHKYPHFPILLIASSDNDKVITKQDVLQHVHNIKMQEDAEHNPNLS